MTLHLRFFKNNLRSKKSRNETPTLISQQARLIKEKLEATTQ